MQAANGRPLICVTELLRRLRALRARLVAEIDALARGGSRAKAAEIAELEARLQGVVYWLETFRNTEEHDP
jgi:hypothetical protein